MNYQLICLDLDGTLLDDQKKILPRARTYALCGIMDVMVGALRGVGYSIMPMIVSLIGACGLRLLWLATVFQIDRYHTVTTVYLSYPITWIITLSVHILCFVLIRRKQMGK